MWWPCHTKSTADWRLHLCVCVRVCEHAHTHVSAFCMTHDGVHALLRRMLSPFKERLIEEERRITYILINPISNCTSCDLRSPWCCLLFYYASTLQTTWKNSSVPPQNAHTEPAASDFSFWFITSQQIKSEKVQCGDERFTFLHQKRYINIYVYSTAFFVVR